MFKLLASRKTAVGLMLLALQPTIALGQTKEIWQLENPHEQETGNPIERQDRLLLWHAARAQTLSLHSDATHDAQWKRALLAAHPAVDASCASCHQGVHFAVANRLAALTTLQHSNPTETPASENLAQSAGVDVEVVSASLRAQLALPDGQGLVVTKVYPDSPAAQAGVKQHDILLKVGDTPLTVLEDLQKVLEGTQGDLDFVAVTGGKVAHYPITWSHLGPRLYLSLEPSIETVTPPTYRIGIRTADTDATLRSHLGLTDGRGVVVSEVIADTPAQRAGICVHDVLLSANDRPLSQLNDLRTYLQEIGNKTVTIKFIREGKSLSLEVLPELHAEPQVIRIAPRLADYYQLNLAYLADRVVWPTSPTTGPKTADDLEPKLQALVQQSKQLSAALEALEVDLKNLKESPSAEKK